MKKSNLITLSLTLGLACGMASAAMPPADISGNWAQSDINTMMDMQVMSGFNDGNFHPDAWLTRSEFSQMAARTLGLESKKANSVPSFKQVSQNGWAFGNVENQDWINNYPSGVFRPTNPVRRVEALAAVGGALNKPLLSEAETNAVLSKYSDADQVPNAARRQVATAIQYDLFEIDPASGPNKIEPLRPINRAETAALLNDLYQNRDIAIVQNGKVLAQTEQAPSTGTSAVSGGYSTTESTEAEKIGYKSPPFRNSADTIVEFRKVNTTTTPTNLEAQGPISLPANTTFTGTVAKALYSEFNKPGDPVMLILDHPLFDTNGKIIAPAGSKVLGVINSVISKNQTNDNAQLGITFNGFITPEGQRIPMSATIANTDGILKATELQGVVFHPDRSTAALSREISTSAGALYGTKIGKAEVLDEPLVQQLSSKEVDPLDKRNSNIVIGVGDRLQIRIESLGVSTTGTGAGRTP
ncbi:S-layer homology domain-containing protein [Vampirovibrio chlorellavorus]|uniref:S-layer homology domain-containing protein n=1 Tax=Vampirovibrio chlorellavorus TaxID=758823 RepID=UPI0026EFBEBB|nr:S-layer homology domain-containing protein [Vampirovibrio chlorellavorus]